MFIVLGILALLVIIIFRSKVFMKILSAMLTIGFFFLLLFSIVMSTQNGRTDPSKFNTYSIPAPPGFAFQQATYSWQFRTSTLKRKAIKVNMEILEQDVIAAVSTLARVEKMNSYELGITTLFEFDPVEWNRQYYQGVCGEFYRNDRNRITRIATGFTTIAKEEGLKDEDLVRLITTFVQNIEYKIPKETVLELLPPSLTLVRQYGDCDTKSLLMIMILKNIGVDAVLYTSRYYKHAMAGIAINATGENMLYKGKRYYFLESTRPGWNFGTIPPDASDIMRWRLIEL